MEMCGRHGHSYKKVSISPIQQADVVCCTCVAAGDRRLSQCDFEMVLIDECGQVSYVLLTHIMQSYCNGQC